MTIKKDVILRTIALIIVIANQTLVILDAGIVPADSQAYKIISLIATGIISLWNWWKNNSFTSEAIQADAVLNSLKEGRYSDE